MQLEIYALKAKAVPKEQSKEDVEECDGEDCANGDVEAAVDS